MTDREPGAAAPAQEAPVQWALSVVIPVYNEAENVAPLAREVESALAGCGLFEIVFVDDGSTDSTAAEVRAARREGMSEIRLICHAQRRGQSAALHSGVSAARAEWVATLDGDGQNDPADIPRLLSMRDAAGTEAPQLLIGHRRKRRDGWVTRCSSRIANAVRRRVLRDATPDTGCGLKLMHRRTFMNLPAFDHMHRFLPALFRRAGAQVVSVQVNHRPRVHGRSKYGIANRLWAGIVDLIGVRWLMSRGWPDADTREE